MGETDGDPGGSHDRSDREHGVWGAAARAEEPSFLLIGIGAFEVGDSDSATAEGRAEFAPGWRILDVAPFFRGIGPMVGVMANVDGGLFGYGGIFADVRIGERIVIRPQFGGGGYPEGSSKDLGGAFQCHIAGEAADRFDNGDRLGIMAAHISNNGVHDSNPGEDEVLITYSMPISGLF